VLWRDKEIADREVLALSIQRARDCRTEPQAPEILALMRPRARARSPRFQGTAKRPQVIAKSSVVVRVRIHWTVSLCAADCYIPNPYASSPIRAIFPTPRKGEQIHGHQNLSPMSADVFATYLPGRSHNFSGHANLLHKITAFKMHNHGGSGPGQLIFCLQRCSEQIAQGMRVGNSGSRHVMPNNPLASARKLKPPV